jgi:general secretion pathway protein G
VENKKNTQIFQERAGFTLIEVMAVMLIIGIISALAIPRFSTILNDSRINKTKQRMMVLKKAIVGDADVTTSGGYANVGYEGDVGALPSSKDDLKTKPALVSVYNKWTKKGWNGPYVKETSTDDYKYDVWGTEIQYNAGARTLTSYGPDKQSGGGDDIVLNF